MHKALVKINLLRKPTKSQLFLKISVVTLEVPLTQSCTKQEKQAGHQPGVCFSKVPGTFRARKVVLCLPCFH